MKEQQSEIRKEMQLIASEIQEYLAGHIDGINYKSAQIVTENGRARLVIAKTVEPVAPERLMKSKSILAKIVGDTKMEYAIGDPNKRLLTDILCGNYSSQGSVDEYKEKLKDKYPAAVLRKAKGKNFYKDVELLAEASNDLEAAELDAIEIRKRQVITEIGEVAKVAKVDLQDLIDFTNENFRIVEKEALTIER